MHLAAEMPRIIVHRVVSVAGVGMHETAIPGEEGVTSPDTFASTYFFEGDGQSEQLIFSEAFEGAYTSLEF
jgi:hypothetical protein